MKVVEEGEHCGESPVVAFRGKLQPGGFFVQAAMAPEGDVMERINVFAIGCDDELTEQLSSFPGFSLAGTAPDFDTAVNTFRLLAVSDRIPDAILMASSIRHDFYPSNFATLVNDEHELTVLVIKAPGEEFCDDGFVYVCSPVTAPQLRECLCTATKIRNLKLGMDFLCRGGASSASREELDATVLNEQFKATRRLQQMMIATVQNTIEGIVLVNPQGRIEYLNKAFERIAGKKRSELVGKHIKYFESDKFSSSLLHALKKIAISHNPWKGNIRLDDGIYELFVGATKDRDGNLLGYAAILADISSRRAVEDKFIQEQKMDAVVTLAGGVAHDFNNIILALQANVETLMELSEPDEIGEKYFKRILAACERAGLMVKKFLNLSRNIREETSMVSVGDTLREVAGLLEASVAEKISFELNIAPGCKDIYANPGSVFEIVMNLIHNAVDAIKGDSGKIMISLKPVLMQPDNNMGLAPGEYVRLAVADTGEGISDELAGRIFEPFFSTKKSDKGYGLGLSVVHQIVESLNGHIGLRSKPEECTEFYVYLPVGKQDKEVEADLPQNQHSGPEHILWICELVAEESAELPGVLRASGYNVTMVCGAMEAMDMFSNNPLKFDMVISDKVIRAVDGRVLFKHIFNIRPDVPAILFTRQSDTIEISLSVANKLVMLIKPVEEATLADTVKILFSKRDLSARLMQTPEQ